MSVSNVADDIRTLVEFLVLARNRKVPGNDLEAYVQKLHNSLQFIELSSRADFLFLYIVFDFHGLLVPPPERTKVYPKWYKSYRAEIAKSLGVTMKSTEWRTYMQVMKTLPAFLRLARERIITRNLANGSRHLADEVDRNHAEHAKFWCAMRYSCRYWSSVDSLDNLLNNISENCRYDVPLFSQIMSSDKRPKRGDPDRTSEVPEANKVLEIDFLPSHDGLGYEAFHLPDFQRRPSVLTSKRKGDNLMHETTKKSRVAAVGTTTSINESIADVSSAVDISGDVDISSDVDLFEVNPVENLSPRSRSSDYSDMPSPERETPLSPPYNPSSPIRDVPSRVLTVPTAMPVGKPIELPSRALSKPNSFANGLHIINNPAASTYRTTNLDYYSLLHVAECAICLSEFGLLNVVDSAVCRHCKLTRVKLKPEGESMSNKAAAFVGKLRELSFDEVPNPTLAAKIFPACISSLQALSITNITHPLCNYGFTIHKWRQLRFLTLKLAPGQQMQFYEAMGTETVAEVINKIFSLAPMLVGLRLPIPREDNSTGSLEISLAGVAFPDNFHMLELESHCPSIYIDLRGLHQLALRYLCLINLFVSPLTFLEEEKEGDTKVVHLNTYGPRLYIGGRGRDNTLSIMRHILIHRPFCFRPAALIPQKVYPPILFSHEWDQEVALQVHGLPRQLIDTEEKFGPFFYPAIIPPRDRLLDPQLFCIPSKKRVIYTMHTAEPFDEEVEDKFIKFSL